MIKLIKKFFRKLRGLWRTFGRLNKNLTLNEKRLVFVLLFLMVILGIVRIDIFIQDNTLAIPADGGFYQEILVGEVKHPNPILARSSVDQTISNLLYPGLSQIDQNGKVVPLLAENWSVPEEGKKYVFHLRKDIFWHDGRPLAAKDVEYTIKSIQDTSNQSPHFANWQGVTISIPDDYTIEFSLAEKSAPFLAATVVGIIPAHVPFKDLDRTLVGSGPYSVNKSTLDKTEKISELQLDQSNQWFGIKPRISHVNFLFTNSLEESEKKLTETETAAISGRFYRQPNTPEKSQIFEIPTNRKLMIFINSNAEGLKEQSLRSKVINREQVNLNRSLSLVTDKKSRENDDLKSLVGNWRTNGLNIEIFDYEAGQLQEKIVKREYDLLAVPVEFGVDLDLYPFFHSSQRSQEGLNFSNLEDKELDKLLEEARTNLDESKRSELQGKIEEKIKTLALLLEVDRESFFWVVSDRVKGLPGKEELHSLEGRFFNIANWYINERRVLK